MAKRFSPEFYQLDLLSEALNQGNMELHIYDYSYISIYKDSIEFE